MKVWVTGGQGFVGQNLQRVQPDWDYTTPGDLLNLSVVSEYIKKSKPDLIIHAAGYVGGLGMNLNPHNRWLTYCNNTQMSLNVIGESLNQKVPRVISILSTAIFPKNLTDDRHQSENIHSGYPHESNFPYAFAKRNIEVMTRIARELGFNYSCITPCNMYGPFDNFDIQSGSVVAALIHKSYLNHLKIWGDGTALRQFMFALDFVNIISYIVDSGLTALNTIIAPPEQHSISDVVNCIQTFNPTTEEWLKNKPVGVLNKFSVETTSENLIPTTNLSTGIDLTMKWFWDNYPNIRGVDSGKLYTNGEID